MPLSSALPVVGSEAGALDPRINPQLGEFGSLMQPWSEEFTGVPDIKQDPSYQFRLQEGADALERSAAARGGLLTGATAKAMERYAQDYASTEYANAYQRSLGEYQQAYNIFNQNQANQYNRLAGMAGLGQTAAGQLASSGQYAAGNIGNILLGGASQQAQAMQNAAAARASGYVGGANAWGGALQGGTNNLSQLLLLSQLFGQGQNPGQSLLNAWTQNPGASWIG